ncbi:hypothetical protein ACFYP4_22275 [Streptomyces sp. NPDC005551]|uniref:hypothetical protein n=1 Tax=unclassified Streptomyces TaxID=2593676 RepID=UPI0033F37E7D
MLRTRIAQATAVASLVAAVLAAPAVAFPSGADAGPASSVLADAGWQTAPADAGWQDAPADAGWQTAPADAGWQ